MRLAWGMAAMAAIGVSAHAAEPPAAGGARLHVTDTDPLVGEHVVVVARRFRLRIAGIATAWPSFGVARLHGRTATAMVDFFPLDGSGFHLSGGTRFHVRRDFLAEADGAARGLLFAPRGGGGGIRNGVKRFTPTATAGYTGSVGGATTLGLEAGVALGRAFMGGPRAQRLGSGAGGWQARGGNGGGNRSERPNPMINMVLGVRF